MKRKKSREAAEAVCRRKQVFNDVLGAELVARSINRYPRNRKVEVYCCSVCGKYHIGTPYPGDHGHRKANPSEVKLLERRNRGIRMRVRQKRERSREAE